MINIPSQLIEQEKSKNLLFKDYYNMLLQVGFDNIFEVTQKEKTTILLHHDDGLIVKIDNHRERLNSKQLYYSVLFDYGTDFPNSFNSFYNIKNDSGNYISYGDGRDLRLGSNSEPLETIHNVLNHFIILKDWIKPNLIFPENIYVLNEVESKSFQFENFLNTLSNKTKKIFINKIVPEHMIHEDSYYENSSAYEKIENRTWNDFLSKHHNAQSKRPNKNSQIFYQQCKDLLFDNKLFDFSQVSSEKEINLFYLLSHIQDNKTFNDVFDCLKNNTKQQNLTLLNNYNEVGLSPILHAIKMFNMKLEKQTKENIECFLSWAFKTYKNDLVLFNEKESLINVIFSTKYSIPDLYDLIIDNNINIKIPFHEFKENKVISTHDFDIEKIEKLFNPSFTKLSLPAFETLLVKLEKKQLEEKISIPQEKSLNKVKI